MATENKNREEDASALSSHYVFCPGRVCLFGEHSDWAGGMRRFNPEIPVGKTLVCGTNVGIHARTRALPTLLIVTSTDEMGNKHGPFSVPMEPEALLAVANQGTFFSYAAGVAYHMLCHYRVGGLEIDNDMLVLTSPVINAGEVVKKECRLDAAQGTIRISRVGADGELLLPMDSNIDIEEAALKAGQLHLRGHARVTP